MSEFDIEKYQPPRRGLGMSPVLAEFLNPPVCQKSGLLVYADNQAAPCTWIEQVKQWALTTDEAYHINRYVTDDGMDILVNHKHNIELLPDEEQLIGDLNMAIYHSPRPDVSFPVLRGIYLDPNYPLVPGVVIVNGITRSGSLDPGIVLQSYYTGDERSVILRIHIPKDSVITWHPSEDQVIFPIGARFLITSAKRSVSMPVQWGPDQLPELVTQDVIDAIYIDAPDQALTRPITSEYQSILNTSLYTSMRDQGYDFPYRAPLLLKYPDLDPRFTWTARLYGEGYTADCVNGIVYAVRVIRSNIRGTLELQYDVGLAEQRRIISYDQSMRSGSNAYTVMLSDGSRVNVSNASEFLRGFISVTSSLNLDYNPYIINITDSIGITYAIYI